MKTQETTTPQMDEIVFEKRNKMYGAYILRKLYNKQLTRGLFMASAILIAGLAYPLVSSFTRINPGRYVTFEDESTILSKLKPFVEPPALPKPPPSTTEIQKRVVFTTPIVMPGEVISDVDLFNQEDLFKNSPNIKIDINEEKLAEKQPDIILVPEEKKEIFIDAQEMPSFPGGDTERLRFLADNIQYPQQASELGIQGTVYLQFVVDSKGNITDVKILRGIGGGCEEEALRVIKMMPQWHPGKQNGKTVRVLYTMPVSFKLQG